MANNNERRWSVPSKRAKGYAEERKAKVHQHGPKEGKELTDYEAGTVSDNGGYAVVKGDYVYYINGKAESTADNAFGKVVKGALVRTKIADLATAAKATADTE